MCFPFALYTCSFLISFDVSVFFYGSANWMCAFRKLINKQTSRKLQYASLDYCAFLSDRPETANWTWLLALLSGRRRSYISQRMSSTLAGNRMSTKIHSFENLNTQQSRALKNVLERTQRKYRSWKYQELSKCTYKMRDEEGCAKETCANSCNIM